MKNIIKKSLIWIYLFTLLFSVTAHAETLSALSIQQDVLVSESAHKSVQAEVEMEIVVPDYPNVDPIVFNQRAVVPYTINGNSLSIMNKNLPVFFSELKDIPKSFQPITVWIGVEDRFVTANWEDSRDVKVGNIDLRVTAYKIRQWQISDNSAPLVDVVLKDVQVEVEDVDWDNRVIELSFSSSFPSTDNDLFNEFLAGKRVEGYITIEAE